MESQNSITVTRTKEDWKKQLSPEQYYIIRQKATEHPYTGRLLMNEEKGVYKYTACGNELFTDGMKFDAHSGWPSFDKEIAGGKIKTQIDNSLGFGQTEITCAKCGGHLGHLFDDGPTETGLRYCVNSLSLEFVGLTDLEKQAAENHIQTKYLGGGCYWCVEAVYQMLDGVISLESGFTGGKVPNPTYEEVCSGRTGYAGVVQITYDSDKTSLDEILKVSSRFYFTSFLLPFFPKIGKPRRRIVSRQFQLPRDFLDPSAGGKHSAHFLLEITIVALTSPHCFLIFQIKSRYKKMCAAFRSHLKSD